MTCLLLITCLYFFDFTQKCMVKFGKSYSCYIMSIVCQRFLAIFIIVYFLKGNNHSKNKKMSFFNLALYHERVGFYTEMANKTR